jgi:inhibitor of cysteine peptidase
MNGLKTIAAIALGLILVAGISCGGASESPKVNVDASYNGSEVALAVGDQLIITLDSNVTTGFSWNLSAISDTAVIQKISDEYITPESSDPPLMGQGGQEVWTFEALAAGSATISMKYIQPWAPDAEPAETFGITVNIE